MAQAAKNTNNEATNATNYQQASTQVESVAAHMSWFDKKGIEGQISNIRKSLASVALLSAQAFRDAIGHALIHGNAALVTEAYSLMTKDDKATAIQMVKNMNKTMLPSNKIAGGIEADFLTFSAAKDDSGKVKGFNVKQDRMKARNHFIDGKSEAATSDLLLNVWNEAIATLKAAEKEEKQETAKTVKPSAEYVKASLDRLVKTIGENYSTTDVFANDVYKELQALARRAEAILKQSATGKAE